MFSIKKGKYILFVLSAIATSASASGKSDLYCSVSPNAAFADQVCARSVSTGQCTVSWSFKNDNVTKSKQKEAMDSCQRYLGNVVTRWNPDNYSCVIYPNASFPTEVCAANKVTGQCTQSWPFSNDDITGTKQKAAFDKCQRLLGKVVTRWNPANYYCAIYPNAAFPTEVCAKSKVTGQCTHSWPFSDDNATKSKQKEAFAKCERFLN